MPSLLFITSYPTWAHEMILLNILSSGKKVQEPRCFPCLLQQDFKKMYNSLKGNKAFEGLKLDERFCDSHNIALIHEQFVSDTVIMQCQCQCCEGLL